MEDNIQAANSKVDFDVNELMGLQQERFQITPEDFLLGITDLTGELMRLTINSVSIPGLHDLCLRLLQFMGQIYAHFCQLPKFHYELDSKLRVMEQSLRKVENACCALKVRGSEYPMAPLNLDMEDQPMD